MISLSKGGNIMDYTFNWSGFLICILALFGGIIVGVSYRTETAEQVLSELCIKSHGKYDFCIKEESYRIKVPEYNKGTPIFGISKEK